MRGSGELLDIAEETKGNVCIIRADSLQPAASPVIKLYKRQQQSGCSLLSLEPKEEGVASFLLCFFFTSVFLIALSFVIFSCV